MGLSRIKSWEKDAKINARVRFLEYFGLRLAASGGSEPRAYPLLVPVEPLRSLSLWLAMLNDLPWETQLRIASFVLTLSEAGAFSCASRVQFALVRDPEAWKDRCLRLKDLRYEPCARALFGLGKILAKAGNIVVHIGQMPTTFQSNRPFTVDWAMRRPWCASTPVRLSLSHGQALSSNVTPWAFRVAVRWHGPLVRFQVGLIAGCRLPGTDCRWHWQ